MGKKKKSKKTETQECADCEDRFPDRFEHDLIEDGITLADLGLKSVHELEDIMCDPEQIEELDSRELGFYNPYQAYHDSDSWPAVAHLVKYKDAYIVYGDGEMIRGYGDFSESEFLLTASKEHAMAYLESIPEGEPRIEDQMKALHEELDEEIPGLWFDIHLDGWNLKLDYKLLLEKQWRMDAGMVRNAVGKYRKLEEELEAKGLKITEMYKAPRKWNDNQRYYAFTVLGRASAETFQVHIPSKFQGQPRSPMDFFPMDKMEGFMKQDQKDLEEFVKERARKEEFEKAHDCTTPPFSFQEAQELFGFVAGRLEKAGGCDGTLKHAREWLKGRLGDDDAVLDAEIFLENHGGFCDCEVLMNTADEPW